MTSLHRYKCRFTYPNNLIPLSAITIDLKKFDALCAANANLSYNEFSNKMSLLNLHLCKYCYNQYKFFIQENK